MASTTDQTLDALVRAQADRFGDKACLRFGRTTAITFAELADLSGQAAGGLGELGVEPGGRIAVWGENGLGWVILTVAAAWRGASVVGLHPALTGDELVQALARSGAQWLFVVPSSSRYNLPAVASDALDVDPSQPLTGLVRRHPACPGLRGITFLRDSPGAAGLPGLAGWNAPRPAGDAAAPLSVQLTSGSSGRPKMVGLATRALLANASATAAAAGIGQADRIASGLPLAHASGLGSGAVLSLQLGATWSTLPRFHPVQMLELLRDDRATVVQVVPTMLAMMLEVLREEGATSALLPDLKLGFVGGAPCSATLCADAKRVLGLERMAVVYGQTEAGPTISLDPDDGSCPPLTTTVGRPVPGVTIRCTAPGRSSLHPREVGEVLVRSPGQMLGYVDDARATRAAVDVEGWLHTGDIGEIDEDGCLRLGGRLSHLIIRGGENVSPAEVEAALVSHSAVAQACVVDVPSERWGQEVGAAVVPATGTADIADLLKHAGRTLSHFKVPTVVELVTELPLLGGGKVDRDAVRQLLATAHGEAECN